MNNEIISIEEVEKEANEALDAFKVLVEDDIKRVSHFKRANLDELLKMILVDCQDFSELESYVKIMENRIDYNLGLKEKLLYQKKLSKKDIIYENIVKIYLIYNIMLGTVWITSSDMLAFIRNFLITSLIGGSTFWINLKYFTSERRRIQIDNTIEAIDNVVEINQYDIQIFNRFRSMYISKLTYELNKLFDIVNINDYNYEKIKKLLNDLQIDFLLQNKSIKQKIKEK